MSNFFTLFVKCWSQWCQTSLKMWWCFLWRLGMIINDTRSGMQSSCLRSYFNLHLEKQQKDWSSRSCQNLYILAKTIIAHGVNESLCSVPPWLSSFQSQLCFHLMCWLIVFKIYFTFYSVISQFVYVFLPGRQPLNYHLCSNSIPGPSQFKVNWQMIFLQGLDLSRVSSKGIVRFDLWQKHKSE